MDNENTTIGKDDLVKTLDRINLWITNCDTKTSIVIAAMGVVLTIILSKDYAVKVKAIISHMTINMNALSLLYLSITAISIIVTVVGCYCLFRVLVPHKETNIYKENLIVSDSLIFFSSIANSKSFKDYKNKIETSSDDDLRNDLISQIYICSKICDQKFNSYKKGITLVVGGFIVFISITLVGFMVV